MAYKPSAAVLERRREAARLYLDGASYETIAQMLGCQRQSVHTYIAQLRGYGYDLPSRMGEQPPPDAPRNRYGHRCAVVLCEVCDDEYEVQWSTRQSRRVCSRTCAVELKRRESNGKWRWYAARGIRCEHPDCLKREGRLALHHVCYEQHVRREGGNVWDPANAMTLCDRCHASHHQRGCVIPTTSLKLENLTFTADLMGSHCAVDYLRRHYDDTTPDPRLVALAGE